MSSSGRRNAPAPAIAALLVVGVLLIVVAVLYFTRTAGALPSFFPGHKAGDAHHHTKHGIAAAAVAVVCLAGAWFGTGRRSTPTAAL